MKPENLYLPWHVWKNDSRVILDCEGFEVCHCKSIRQAEHIVRATNFLMEKLVRDVRQQQTQ